MTGGSGLIPKAFVDDLITRIDVVDLIDGYVPLKRAGRGFTACCPFHQEKSPSFHVSQPKQFYHCFGCGANGNAISFMMSYRNLGFREAIIELAARVGLPVPTEKNSAISKVSQDLYTLLSRVTEHYQQQLAQSPQAAKARDYLQQRGLSQAIIDEYQLGYTPDAWHHLSTAFPTSEKALIATGLLVEKPSGTPYDQYRDRVMFPIHDRRGRPIGFGGRVLDPTKLPKYINSPETTLFHKSKVLYGLYQAAQKNPHPDYWLVVEGYMDVIALAQQGIPHAVAALGTATTRDHIQSLLRYSKKIIFCFDGDNAGRKAAWKALESALPCLDISADFYFMFLPEQEDPDTLIRKEGKDAFIQRTTQAKSLDQFFFETLTQDRNLAAMADRSHVIETAKTYFQRIPACAYRDLLSEQLARLVRIDVDKLMQTTHEKTAPISQPVNTSRPSSVRWALTLLIQHPDIMQHINTTPALETLESIQGGALLHEFMTLIPAQSLYSTGRLLEHFRDHAHSSWIQKLMIIDVPVDDILAEFKGTLEKIQQEAAAQQINNVLQKKNAADYSPEERRALLDMIQKRKK